MSTTSTDITSRNYTGADRLNGVQESVWVEFIQLAADHKPLNLGQGFPDFAAPPHVSQALAEATLSSNVLLNQYTRGFVSFNWMRCFGIWN
jgi:kynurenine--oxoglutarate transaminase/cysteine-S-conjugate beta-lyase/glutamine--phenylpyruvate transaminase